MGRTDALPANEESVMAYTGYFKTEMNVGAKVNGWLWVRTYINSPIERIIRRLSTYSQHIRREYSTPLDIYCHQNAAPEPVTDGHILTSVFDDSETEFSGPAGYIHSFTSSTGIFTRNQNLELQPNWTVYFNAKNTGLTQGYVGNMGIEIYKRNSINSDTHLFTSVFSGGVIGLYSPTGYSMTLYSTGTVTTNDRLRIRVKMWQSLPR